MAQQRGPGGRFGSGGGGGAKKGKNRVQLITRFDLIGDWEKAMKVTKTLTLDKAIQQAVKQEAKLGERMMKENMTRGGNPAGSPFKKLSPWTVAARQLGGTTAHPRPPAKGTKPLIAQGDLRNAITSVVVGSGRETAAFVGVLKQAQGSSPGGPEFVNIGNVQEFGKTIVVRMTPKMVRFLAVLAKAAKAPPTGAGKGTGKKFLVIHIPARPFVRPAFALWAKEAPDRFAKRISILTKGALGTP